jgi:hypothetical protein
MAQEKSSLKDNIISGIIFLVALGVLGWRYKDCKEKERKQAQEAAEVRAEAEQKAKQRVQSCLDKFGSGAQTACMKCTCDKCIDEFEECWDDPTCRKLNVGDEDTGDGASLSQVRLKARTECVVSRCRNECLGK